MLGNIIAGTFSAGAPPIPPTSYDSIATVTVGSGGSASIDFTSIPSTYKHLQLRGIVRCDNTTNTNLQWRLNSDNSNANYNIHILRGTGAAVISEAVVSGSANSFIVANEPVAKSSDTSGIFGVVVIDLLDYSNTSKYKTARALAGRDVNGTGGAITLTSSLWQNTAAVSSISLSVVNSLNFVQHTQFALYGIRD
jgi:hypothetical protein